MITPSMKKRRMKSRNLLSARVYESDRYIITGNIGYQLIINDKQDNKRYIISYDELVKFRDNWDNVSYVNKDRFVTIMIICKVCKDTQEIVMVG